MTQLSKGPRAVVKVLLLAVVLAACAPRFQPGGENSGIARSDFLFLRTAKTMVAFPIDGGSVRTVDLPVVSAPGWSRLFTAVPRQGSTEVIAVESESGNRRRVAMVRGDVEPAAIAMDGHTVAFSPRRKVSESLWVAEPRERTDLVIVGSAGGKRRFSLPGNFQPEAFSADARRLFMIEYIPASAPDRYRVRQLDLASGVVSPVGGRLKQSAPEEMKGIGRTQNLSPDGATLYTLYTRQVESYPHGRPEHLEPDANSLVHSFIHVLNLKAGWAHCVDLPHPFGMSSTNDDAFAISHDGRWIYVADGSAGRTATVDTQQLKVVRTGEFDKPADGGKVGVQVSGEGTLFVTSGDKVLLIEARTLTKKGEFQLPLQASGALLGPADSLLFVSVSGAVLKLDSSSGDILERLDVPGMESIAGIGG